MPRKKRAADELVVPDVEDGKRTASSATPVNGWRPGHLSHSAVDRFERCARSYYDSYVLNNRFPATRPMLIGSLFGKGIEDVHNGVYEGPPTISKHFLALRKAEQETLEQGDAGLVARMVAFYMTAGEGYPYVGTPEYEFRVYLPDCGENKGPVPVPILGFMDVREHGRPLIHEFKTGKFATHSEWGWSQQRVNTSPQAAIYWYADQVLHGRDSLVRYTILGYAYDRISMIHLETQPDMRRVLEFRDKAAKLWRALEEEAFPCLCGKCGRLA